MRNDEGDSKRGAGVSRALMPSGQAGGQAVNPNGGKNYRKVYADRVTAGKQPIFLPPSRKGAKSPRIGFGFTPTQTQRMSRGIQWMQAKYGRERLVFVTLTFGYEIDHDEAKTRWSTLQKRIKRKYKAIDYVWVAEIQPARLIRTGEAVIHFHAVFSRYLGASWLWNAWEEINGERFRVDIQSIKTNAAAYMSKYLAKQGREGRAVADSLEAKNSLRQKADAAKQNKEHWKLLAQLKMREDAWNELDDDMKTMLAEKMTIQGNRMGMTQAVSRALKPVKVDEVEWRNAVPKERQTQLKFAEWNEENFTFLGVWGFDND